MTGAQGTRLVLLIGLVALCTLLVVLEWLRIGTGDSYLETLRSIQLTRDSLFRVMLIAGLLALSAASVMTWLALIYASFRYAGPIYRFRRTLESQLQERGSAALPIRNTDALQDDSVALQRALSRATEHEARLLEELDRWLAATDADEPDRQERHLNLLRRVESEVRL